MIRPAAALAIMAMLAGPACGAEVEGIVFPDAKYVLGTTLRLNGAGVRLYSVFRVPVYAAALYLEQQAGDADAILNSHQRKAIEVRALRAVPADDIRSAWRASFAANCKPPCRLTPDADAFLAAVQASRERDAETYLLDGAGLLVVRNGQPAGAYAPAFGRLLLSTFIGQSPPTEALKRALLGGTR